MAQLKEPSTVDGEAIKPYADDTIGSVRNTANARHDDMLAQTVMTEPQIVDNETEAEDQRGEEQDFETVYNEWTRISHAGGERPADSDEIDAWEYDSDNDQIRCTVNSTTLLGFVSPETYDEYVFEVIVNASNDDDQLGLILAYAEDSDGLTHTLVAMRSCNGTGQISTEWFVAMDPAWSEQSHDPDPYHIVYAADMDDTDLSPTGGRWDDYSNGVKIRVERNGDDFTVKTTNLDDPDGDFVESETVTFNLNDSSELSVFQGPCSIGYCAHSNDTATYQTVIRPSNLDDVYDIENDTLWTYDSEKSEWVSTSVEGNLTPLRFYWNYKLERLYLTDPDNVVYRVAQYKDLP